MKEKQRIELEIKLKEWINYLNCPDQFQQPTDQWLDVNETCTLLRFSRVTLYRKCKSGELIYSKPSTIMIWLSDIAKYVLSKENS